MKRLILASSSPRRYELLKATGLPFEVETGFAATPAFNPHSDYHPLFVFDEEPAPLDPHDAEETFGSLFGMLFLNRLPRLYHPLLKNKRFALVTHDRFFLVVETDDPKFSETETRALLETAGSKHIELVEE